MGSCCSACCSRCSEPCGCACGIARTLRVAANLPVWWCLEGSPDPQSQCLNELGPTTRARDPRQPPAGDDEGRARPLRPAGRLYLRRIASVRQRRRGRSEQGPRPSNLHRLGHHPSVANGRLRHMRIGYACVSKADGSQSLDLQRGAPAGRGRRRGPRLPRLRLRRPRRPPWNSTAACVRFERATCSSSGSSTAWAATSSHLVNTVQDPVDPRRGPAGAHRARRADRHHHGRPAASCSASSRRWPSSSWS